jgi:hypothetical protein
MKAQEYQKPNNLEEKEVPPVASLENQQEREISQEEFFNFADTEEVKFKQETSLELENANNGIALDQDSFERVKNETGVEQELDALDKEAEGLIAISKNEALNKETPFSNEGQSVTNKEGGKTVEEDARYKEIYEKEALSYLKSYDSKYFNENYSGIGADGFLLDKEGNHTSSLPSQNIPVFKNGLTFPKFRDKVKEKFFDQYPDAEASARNVPVEQVLGEHKEKALSEIKNAIEDRKRIRLMKGGEKLGGYEEEQLIKKYTELGLLSNKEIEVLKEEKKEEEVGMNQVKNTKPEESSMEIGKESPGGDVLEQFKNIGIRGEVVTMPNNATFSEAIIFPKNLSNEKLVRLYRGLTSLDESVVNQVSPSLRLELGDRKVATLDFLKDSVEKLTENPNYQNLVDYVESVKSHLSDRERSSLEADLRSIEDQVLEGRPLRRALVFNQISYPGGVPVSGISPYLSSTKNPLDAIGYSNGGGLVVIDIPASKLESFGRGASEVNIKAFLSPEYITAILPTKNNNKENFDEQDLYNAIALIDSSVPTTHVEVPEPTEEEIEMEKSQEQVDRTAIQEKRLKDLWKSFPEVAIPQEGVQKTMTELNTDVYSATRLAIFDHFENQLKRLRPNHSLEEYNFQVFIGFGEIEKFDRKNITDAMLLKARDFVERISEKESAREGLV